DALLATAETVPAPAPGAGPTPCATAEESEVVLRWLERPGTRLVEVEGEWCSPAGGAGRLREWLDVAEQGREAATPFDDRRGLRPVARPHRALAG
ncbi:MAG: endonuclease, partial [Actinomycetota bacterium]|nr:endonuclease [Actinomycetota bacterium]